MLRIKCLYIKPGKAPLVFEIENTLESFQKLVGGYIEIVTDKDTKEHNALMICNEEGKIMDLEPNLWVDNDFVCGNVLIVGDDGDDFKSLNDEQIEYFIRKYEV